MNQYFYRSRAARILTSPPEILYALTRHWILVLVFFVGGVALTWSMVRNALLAYEGRARLLVNPERMVIHDPEARPVNRTNEDAIRFLNTQASILSSDAVIYAVARKIGVQDGLPANEKSSSTAIWKEWKGKFENLIDLRDRGNEASEESRTETLIETYIENFRRRSEVLPDLRGSTIDLRLLGLQRDRIMTELDAWIEAYILQVENMATKSWENFLGDRIQHYRGLETSDMEQLDAFKAQNPEVSTLDEEFLTGEIARLQVHRDDIRRLEEQGLSPDDLRDRVAPISPETDMLDQKRAVELELAEARSKGFTEGSDRVQQLLKKLAFIEEKIRAEEAEKEMKKEKKEKEDGGGKARLSEKLTIELESLIRRKAALKDKLSALALFEGNYKKSREKREGYERMRQESLDMIASQKSVQIQVADKRVSADPVDKKALVKLVLGSVAGIAAGLGLAVAREVTCGKVRFSQDIVGDFGLPVVAVVPRR
jgi:uncharacterized protein involved in exopolysaccharide biosynthesis